jgi:molecular chaperone GrpE (heat shock protein)
VALSSLRRVLRTLGFEEFEVAEGEPFDPARMESLEYAEGEQGVVLSVIRPGYLANEVVVRPCGVRIADPSAAAANETQSEDETNE